MAKNSLFFFSSGNISTLKEISFFLSLSLMPTVIRIPSGDNCRSVAFTKDELPLFPVRARAFGEILATSADVFDPYRQKCDHGFMFAALQAHLTGTCLLIRPDDIWLAIISQLSLYVQQQSPLANKLWKPNLSEQDRELVLPMETVGDPLLVANLRRFFAGLFLNDEAVSWITPNFTTSRSIDGMLALMLMSPVAKRHVARNRDSAPFDSTRYAKVRDACAIPRLYVAGEIDDWKLLAMRIEHILTYVGDDEQERLMRWSQQLLAIVNEFIQSFHLELGRGIFWDHLVSHIFAAHDISSPAVLMQGWIKYLSPFDRLHQWILPDMAHAPLDVQDVASAMADVPLWLEWGNKKRVAALLRGGHVSFGRAEVAEHPYIAPRLEYALIAETTDLIGYRQSLVTVTEEMKI